MGIFSRREKEDDARVVIASPFDPGEVRRAIKKPQVDLSSSLPAVLREEPDRNAAPILFHNLLRRKDEAIGEMTDFRLLTFIAFDDVQERQTQTSARERIIVLKWEDSIASMRKIGRRHFKNGLIIELSSVAFASASVFFSGAALPKAYSNVQLAIAAGTSLVGIGIGVAGFVFGMKQTKKGGGARRAYRKMEEELEDFRSE